MNDESIDECATMIEAVCEHQAVLTVYERGRMLETLANAQLVVVSPDGGPRPTEAGELILGANDDEPAD